jgi:ParB family chromosome partitioning protein
VVRDESGTPLATLAIDGRSVAIKITRKDNPEFGQWVEENAEAMLRQIFNQWRNERGPGS